ncbi:MAG TPA: HAD family phosphatase [Trichocoleus sp.]
MVRHIVSDMGGVLVEIEWRERIAGLLNRPIGMEELHRLWVTTSSTLDFECGRTSFDQFTQAFINQFELSVTPEHFKAQFLEVVQAPLPNCEAVLAALKPHFHLSLLSNTNPAHYDKLSAQYNFFEAFDDLFLSFQIGCMKPDEQIFRHVIEALGTTPDQIAFFDDGKRNVEAARQVGIQAFQVTSPDALLEVVNQHWRVSA